MTLLVFLIWLAQILCMYNKNMHRALVGNSFYAKKFYKINKKSDKFTGLRKSQKIHQSSLVTSGEKPSTNNLNHSDRRGQIIMNLFGGMGISRNKKIQ
jgi:hypothetical protein